MFKKDLDGATWHGKGFKVLVCEANEKLLRKFGADVFNAKEKQKKAKDDSTE